jgi:hypothetical protein
VKGTANKVMIRLLVPNGLTTGIFATVNCDVAAGSTPLPADFTITSNITSTTGVFALDTTALAGVNVECGAIGTGLGTLPQTSRKVVTLSTAGTLPNGALIGVIDITLNLPAGVTVQSSPSSLNAAILLPADGVVVLQGVAVGASNQLLTPSYVKGPPGKVGIRLVSGNGLSTGAFAAVNCDVAPGAAPLPSDFSITPNVTATTGVFDVNTAALSGVNVTISVK